MAKQIIQTGTTPNDGTGDTLRGAFSKTNQNFTELYTQSSNSWVSPITSNSWNVVQASGASYVNVGDPLRISINAVATYSNTDVTDIVISANTQANTVLASAWDSIEPYHDIISLVSRMYVNGNTYNWDGLDAQEGNTWMIYLAAQETLAAGDPVDISLVFMPVKKAWINFDNIVSDFRGAKLTYRVRVDGANGYTEIGEISCIKTNDSSNIDSVDVAYTSKGQWPYADSSDNTVLNQFPARRARKPLYPAIYDGVNTRYQIPSITEANGNSLYYSTVNYPYGNLHIQWSGTVFGGRDW